MTMWKPDICVYHGGCDDGFGAAWSVRRRWPSGVTYVPGAYGGFNWPREIAGKNILFVDFSLKRDQMVQLADGGLTGEIPRSIVVLDHHKTAEAELRQWSGKTLPLNDVELLLAKSFTETGYPVVAQFDMAKSGARLAWEFCFPGAAVPWAIRYIEDRDLWRFDLPDTRLFSAALRTYPQDFAVWSRFCDPDNDILTSGLIGEGEAILRGHEKNIGEFCKHAYMMDIGGYSVPVVNVPYHYASDTANALLAHYPDAPFAACWFQVGPDKTQFSLRSEDQRVDVSAIASKLGGGGHRNAAGFLRSVAALSGADAKDGEPT